MAFILPNNRGKRRSHGSALRSTDRVTCLSLRHTLTSTQMLATNQCGRATRWRTGRTCTLGFRLTRNPLRTHRSCNGSIPLRNILPSLLVFLRQSRQCKILLCQALTLRPAFATTICLSIRHLTTTGLSERSSRQMLVASRSACNNLVGVPRHKVRQMCHLRHRHLTL